MEQRRVLVVSYFFPPINVAATHVINSIVKFFPKEEVCVLRGNPKETYQSAFIDDGLRSDVEQYVCDMPGILRKRSFKIDLPVFLNHLWIPVIVLRGLTIVRKKKVEHIFALFPNHYFLIVAYFIHAISRLPLTIYWVDVYAEGRPHFFERWVARLLERKILASARKNFVMTPFQQEHIRGKYGIETEALPIPTEVKPHVDGAAGVPPSGERVEIAFTGAIYAAQLDAIVTLVKATELIREFDVRLLLVTPQDKGELERLGVSGEKVSVFRAPKDECLRIQRHADILFLGLAFNAPRSLVVNLSLPSKMLDYLAAMKPILIHAPSDSYIVHYARERDCAVVVDTPDPEAVKRAILELIQNRERRDTIVRNALSALSEHDARKVSQRIQESLNLTRRN